MLKRVFLLKQIPYSPNFGLLVLRVLVFSMMFMKHGTMKLFSFGQLAQGFPDPLHIGSVATLTIAAISDGICSLLIVVGLATRWAALFSLCNLLVAEIFVHHFALMSWTEMGMGAELIFIFMAACITLICLGPGTFSVDALIEGSGEEKEVSVRNLA